MSTVGKPSGPKKRICPLPGLTYHVLGEPEFDVATKYGRGVPAASWPDSRTACRDADDGTEPTARAEFCMPEGRVPPAESGPLFRSTSLSQPAVRSSRSERYRGQRYSPTCCMTSASFAPAAPSSADVLASTRSFATLRQRSTASSLVYGSKNRCRNASRLKPDAPSVARTALRTAQRTDHASRGIVDPVANVAGIEQPAGSMVGLLGLVVGAVGTRTVPEPTMRLAPLIHPTGIRPIGHIENPNRLCHYI
jgi:hypothetical protein